MEDQGTEHQIGDVVLDELGDAVSAVVAEHETEFGRKPTKPEWEAMLRMVLGNEIPEARAMDEGTVVTVSIDLK